MRHAPNLRTLKFKQPGPDGRVDESNTGQYSVVTPLGSRLTVIATDHAGWDHVSVSLKHRTPAWAEMEFVKSIFFRDDETAMQLHVPSADHINIHPHCLHLWRPQDGEIPRPPNVLVI